MADGLHVVAILKATPGKEDRMQELLTNMTKSVHKNEPGALRYHMHKSTDGGETKFIFIETYKDQAAFDHHTSTDDFKSLFKTLQDDGILSGEPTIATCTSVAGFENRSEALRG